jgi:DNA-binding GntR family transcriptional regulator
MGMPLPQSESKLSRTLARDEVYSRLRAWIIDGRLQPGELLRDQDIAATVGVSRTPVREALRRLEDEGLVETALNRWTRVAPIDIGKATEIYAIVEALELFALETAIRRLTAQDVTRMREANQAMRRAAELQDPAAAVSADESFHEVWIERANNGELSALLGKFRTKLRRVELAYFDAAARALSSFREHAAIIKAVSGRALPAARQAVRRNWRGSAQRLRALVQEESENNV